MNRGNDFLITPDNCSNWDLALDDIVQVKDGKREKGKRLRGRKERLACKLMIG